MDKHIHFLALNSISKLSKLVLLVLTSYSFLFIGSCFANTAPYPIPLSTDKITYLNHKITTKDGLTLHAHLAIPTNKVRPLNGYPVVIMFVGSAPCNRYSNIPAEITANNVPALFFKDLEANLVEKGIAVFLYDKRGCIPKDSSFESNIVTADFKTANADKLASDALSAFDYVSTLDKVDKTKIAILGHSEGTILALKVAKVRPNVKSIFLLGMFSRSWKDILYYQLVLNKLRNFSLYDRNKDGILTKQEYLHFAQLAGKDFFKNKENLSWEKFYEKYSQLYRPGKISKQEFNYTNEEEYKELINAINDSKLLKDFSQSTDWFKQYFQEGSYLEQQLLFCNKMHVFQGEEDPQTPFEDALKIRNACKKNAKPLSSFNSYPGLTHGFSPYVGYNRWRYTIGPMDKKVITDITTQAIKNLYNQ